MEGRLELPGSVMSKGGDIGRSVGGAGRAQRGDLRMGSKGLKGDTI